jgi:hypothetical protein
LDIIITWTNGGGAVEKVPSTLIVDARRSASIPLSDAKIISIFLLFPSTGPEYLNVLK